MMASSGRSAAAIRRWYSRAWRERIRSECVLHSVAVSGFVLGRLLVALLVGVRVGGARRLRRDRGLPRAGPERLRRPRAGWRFGSRGVHLQSPSGFRFVAAGTTVHGLGLPGRRQNNKRAITFLEVMALFWSSSRLRLPGYSTPCTSAG